MAIPQATVDQLVTEGINNVDDLAEFDETSFKQVTENLRRPSGVDAAGNPNRPFTFGAKSQMRLLAAYWMVKFYQEIERPLTAANIRWDPIIKKFQLQWKALDEKRQADDPDTPKVTKALPIMRWAEAFRDHLFRCVGIRNIPLAYVVREDAAVPAVCPPLATNQPFLGEHGSVKDDLIHQASHNDGLYRDNNALAYFKMEEATQGTSYVDSITPFQQNKDGYTD